MLETERTAGQVPVPPGHGEPCEECGSPLAADQRYCLNCGRRRGGPRVDYRHYMGAASQPEQAAQSATEGAQPAPGAEEPPKSQRDYAPLAAVGGIAVLGLMLLVGVLIGKGNNDTAAAPAPVIRVPAAGGETGESEAGGGSKNSSEKGFGGGKAKKAKQGGGGGKVDTGNATKATTDDLENLSGESGESYEKQSENLPNEIATPGKAPPIDKSKSPGGGEGGAEVIK